MEGSALQEGALRGGFGSALTHVSAFCILPASEFLDEFHFVRDFKDGGRGHQPYVKNSGGGVESRTILNFLQEHELGDVSRYGFSFSNELLHKLSPAVLLEIFGSPLWDELLRLAIASEVWEELGFYIPPSELQPIRMPKLLERHIPNRRECDDLRVPHVRAIFAIEKPFPGVPQEGLEIAEHYVFGPDDVLRFASQFAEDHLRAFNAWHDAITEGTEPQAILECSVKDCAYCSSNTKSEGGVR